MRGKHVDLFGFCFFAFFHGYQAGRITVFCRCFAVYFQPAGVDQHAAFALEGLFRHTRDACGHHVFGAGVEHSDKLARHQVVEFLLQLVEVFRRLRGGDNRKVIRDFGVIKDAFVGFYPTLLDDFLGDCAVA